MKKRIMTFGLVLFWITAGIISHSLAQDEKNVLAINPIGIGFGLQNMEFERVLSKNSGIALFWAYNGFAVTKISNVRFQGSEQRITYRYYIKQNAPKGFWVGGSLAYSTGYVDKLGREFYLDGTKGYVIEAHSWSISMLTLGIEVGYRWMLGKFNIAPVAMLRLPLTDNLLGTKVASGDIKIPYAVFINNLLGIKATSGNVKIIPPIYSFGVSVGWGW